MRERKSRAKANLRSILRARLGFFDRPITDDPHWSLGQLPPVEVMIRRPNRNHSPQFKANVALAVLHDEQALAEISKQLGVHPNEISH